MPPRSSSWSRLVGRLAGRDPSPDDLRRQGKERGSLRSDGKILAHREIVEQLGALPRPGETQSGAFVRGHPRELAPVELDPTRRPDVTGDRVDEGRLARTVRPDQADELSLLGVDIDVLHCMHPAKANRKVGRREDGAHDEAASARLRCQACAVR